MKRAAAWAGVGAGLVFLAFTDPHAAVFCTIIVLLPWTAKQ